MRFNKIQFQELINDINLFDMQVEVLRYKTWTTGSYDKDTDTHTAEVNFLLDIAVPQADHSGIIFKEKFIYTGEGMEQQLEERFFTKVVKDLIKRGLNCY